MAGQKKISEEVLKIFKESLGKIKGKLKHLKISMRFIKR
jgi:predicted nuclease of restriction endonuclease-like RecB superfamily